MQDSVKRKRLVVGGIVILIGFVFLLETLGLISNAFSDIVISWQMFLVAIGTIFIFGHRRNVSGIILIVIGIFFLLVDSDVIPINLRDVFWPVMIIAFGFVIIFKHSNVGDKLSSRSGWSGRTEDLKADSEFEDISVFGGAKKNIHCSAFTSGKITSIFGGSEINMTSSKISEQGAIIDVFCMFGGTTIILPPDWVVVVDVVSVFGGFSENNAPAKVTDENNKVLHIKGMVIFGGGEIKRY